MVKTLIKGLYNDLIKPSPERVFDGARSESGGILIEYLSLILYTNPQVKNMSNCHKPMFDL